MTPEYKFKNSSALSGTGAESPVDVSMVMELSEVSEEDSGVVLKNESDLTVRSDDTNHSRSHTPHLSSLLALGHDRKFSSACPDPNCQHFRSNCTDTCRHDDATPVSPIIGDPFDPEPNPLTTPIPEPEPEVEPAIPTPPNLINDYGGERGSKFSSTCTDPNCHHFTGDCTDACQHDKYDYSFDGKTLPTLDDLDETRPLSHHSYSSHSVGSYLENQ